MSADPLALFDTVGAPTVAAPAERAARDYADALTRQTFATWADALRGYSAADRPADPVEHNHQVAEPAKLDAEPDDDGDYLTAADLAAMIRRAPAPPPPADPAPSAERTAHVVDAILAAADRPSPAHEALQALRADAAERRAVQRADDVRCGHRLDVGRPNGAPVIAVGLTPDGAVCEHGDGTHATYAWQDIRAVYGEPDARAEQDALYRISDRNGTPRQWTTRVTTPPDPGYDPNYEPNAPTIRAADVPRFPVDAPGAERTRRTLARQEAARAAASPTTDPAPAFTGTLF